MGTDLTELNDEVRSLLDPPTEPSIVEESLANSTKRVERWRAAASIPPPSARARQDEAR